MKTAIITGASSGLGVEYFRAITELCPEIEEYWLIARRRERLEEIADQFPHVKCKIIPLDLTKPSCYEEYAALLERETPEVMMLVCNAGYGKLGNVEEISAVKQGEMVRLNCESLTVFCSSTIKYMPPGSCIINTSSIASFLTTPRMTVYSATKAYVTSFSRGLAHELKPKGISVTAVCPGPMDTEFLEVANITGNSKMFMTLPRCSAREVATIAVIKAMRGKVMYTNKIIYKLYRVLCKLLPHSLLMKFSEV